VHHPCMAVKTITIDLEAYEALSRNKRPGQSFSQVIKQHFGKVRTGGDLLQAIERVSLSPETLDAVEAQIAARSESPARAPKL
jgi:predicted CopG family antitoxin